MRTRTKNLAWTLLFLLIFALSLDFWRWGEEIALMVGNFPSFLIHFVVLQLLFAGAVLLFIRSGWQEDDEDRS